MTVTANDVGKSYTVREIQDLNDIRDVIINIGGIVTPIKFQDTFGNQSIILNVDWR